MQKSVFYGKSRFFFFVIRFKCLFKVVNTLSWWLVRCLSVKLNLHARSDCNVYIEKFEKPENSSLGGGDFGGI